MDAEPATSNVVTVTVTAAPETKPLTATMVTLTGADNLTYTGTAYEPTVEVKDGETTLVKDTDYTVAYTNNINAGTAATVTVTGKGGYTGKVEKKFTIGKAECTYTPSIQTTVAYNAAYPSESSATFTGADSKSITGTLKWYTDEAHSTPTSGNFTGTSVTLYWVFEHTDNNHVSPKSGSTTFTVSAQPVLTVSPISAISMTYGDAATTITSSVTASDSSTPSSVSYTYAIKSGDGAVSVDSNGKVTALKAGNAVVTVTAAAAGYVSGSVDVNVTVAKKALTIKANDQTITSGGAINTDAAQVTATGLVNGDVLSSITLTAEGTDIKASDAVIMNDTDDVTENYNITYTNGKLTVNTTSINAATVKVTLTPSSATYTGEAQKPTVAVIDGGKTLKENTDYTVTYPAGMTNAGTYTVTIAGKGGYTGSRTETFTIDKATPVLSGITASGPVYTTTDPVDVVITGTAKVGSQTLTGGTWTFKTTPAFTEGEKTYTVVFTPSDIDNYNTAEGSVTITVQTVVKNVASIAVAKNPDTMEYVYGEALDPTGMEVTVTYDDDTTETISSFPDSRISFSTDLGDAAEAKSVTLTWADTSITCQLTDVKVTPKALTVPADVKWNVSGSPFTYDGSEKSVTLDNESSIPSELKVTKTGDKATNAGTYTASAEFALKDSLKAGNYTISVAGTATAEWKISKADPEGHGASLTVSITDTDEKTVAVSRFTSVPGAITLGTPDQNTVFADGYPRMEGGAIKLKLSGELSASDAGSVTIPVTFTPDDHENYNSIDWNLVVEITAKKIPTVAVDDFSRAYNKTAVSTDELTMTATGEGGTTVEGTWTFVAEAPVNAGTYTCKLDFTPTGEYADSYAEVQTDAFTVTIGKVPVTVTGKTLTIPAGQAIPTTLYDVTGLLDGDTLTPAPTVSCEASDPAAEGEYVITVSGPDTSGDGNYSITYEAGKLTVTAAAAEAVAAPTASPNGGSFTGSVSVTLSCATPDAVIYYTTDGSTPTTGSTRYTEAIRLSSSATVKAIAVKDGMDSSSVLSVTFTRSSSSGGTSSGSASNNSGSSTVTQQPVTTVTASQGGSSIKETTATPAASNNGGKATSSVSSAVGSEILKQAISNNSKSVVIAPKIDGSVTQTDVSISGSTLKRIGSETNASLTISTPVADVTIPNSGLSRLSGADGTVTVTAEQTGNTVELSVKANGKSVESISGGVTLTVPAKNTNSGTVAVLIREDGAREVVRKSVSDGSSVTIPLNGSARVEIVDNSKHFDDTVNHWSKDAVAFASSHELFSGVTANTFAPDTSMSRAMVATVLYRLEDAAATGSNAFADVPEGMWYTDAVTWASNAGIVTGTGSGFDPNGNVTREQLAAMLYRYAETLGMGTSAAGDLSQFRDGGKTSDWARDAISWAVGNGLISGKGNDILDPTGTATRAEVAVIMQRLIGLMVK